MDATGQAIVTGLRVMAVMGPLGFRGQTATTIWLEIEAAMRTCERNMGKMRPAQCGNTGPAAMETNGETGKRQRESR